MTSREPNWFYNQAPDGVVHVPVRLKARWALSPRGLRHRVIDASAAWRHGEIRYAGQWLCGDGCTGITLLPDDSDEGRLCVRCDLRDRWPAAPVVYRFSQGDQVVYIGSTGDLGTRLYQHRCQSPWWTPHLRLRVDEQSSLVLARSVEAKAIAAERPVHNQTHNPDRPRVHRRQKQVTCS